MHELIHIYLSESEGRVRLDALFKFFLSDNGSGKVKRVTYGR